MQAARDDQRQRLPGRSAGLRWATVTDHLGRRNIKKRQENPGAVVVQVQDRVPAAGTAVRTIPIRIREQTLMLAKSLHPIRDQGAALLGRRIRRVKARFPRRRSGSKLAHWGPPRILLQPQSVPPPPPLAQRGPSQDQFGNSTAISARNPYLSPGRTAKPTRELCRAAHARTRTMGIDCQRLQHAQEHYQVAR